VIESTAIFLEAARADDLDGVLALLAACDLPTEGLSDQFPGGYVVARKTGAIVGAAGLEIHGTAGVLRSIAVAASERGTGLGVRLTQDRLAAARARGLDAVYLLTTTAAAFYPRFGFEPFPRADVPDEVARCAEFATVCPSSAACLRLRPTRGPC
jgi:amino-acid N-acetyltransferase